MLAGIVDPLLIEPAKKESKNYLSSHSHCQKYFCLINAQ